MFKMSEWTAVQSNSKQKFITDILGERPTHKALAKSLYNPNPISILEWLALGLLLVISVVTAFKMISVALPFAQSFFPDAPIWVVSSFQVATAILFILSSTSGLIFFKLMDENDPEIAKLKLRYSKLKFSGGWQGSVGVATIVGALTYSIIGTSLEVTAGSVGVAFLVALYFGGAPTNLMQYLSPRLYLFLTYATAVWLFDVSSHGEGSFFEKYLIVFAEVALSYLVANLITKYTKRSADIQEALEQRLKPYDERLAGYESDPAYLRILYQEMREAVSNLVRVHPEDDGKRKPRLYKPYKNVTDEQLYTEYLRLTSGLQFAKRVLGTATEEPLTVNSVVSPVPVQAKRTPPNGATKWTVESLEHDFLVRGLKPNDKYTEAQISNDYEAGYNARGAFRAGANLFFAR